jgi:probable phosphoglycerate mutase
MGDSEAQVRPGEARPSPPPLDLFGRLFRYVAPDATELVLVRHGEAAPPSSQDANYDPPLSERGRHQAHLLAKRLAQVPIHALYASPLRRAQETAAVVSDAIGLPVVTVPDLREVDIDLGQLRAAYGQAEREAVIQDMARKLLTQARWDILPGFEPSHSFRLRVRRALGHIVSRHPGQRVVVVCHGGVINMYLSIVLDIPHDIFFLPEHTSLTVVRTSGQRAVVQVVGDHAHLLDDGLEPFTAF